MPAHCCAYNCSNRFGKNKDVTFHKFPKDKKRRGEWAKKVRRLDEKGKLWMPSKNDVICSAHFREEDLDKTGQTTRLRDGVKPVLFNFPSNSKRKALKGRSEKNKEATQPSTPECSTPPKDVSQPQAACADQSKPPPRRSERNKEATQPPTPECSAPPKDVSQQQAACAAQDHCYQLPDSGDLRARVDRLNQHREKLERELRNAKKREKRSRIYCLSLLKDLKKKSSVTKKLQKKLEAFSDFPMDLFGKDLTLDDTVLCVLHE